MYPSPFFRRQVPAVSGERPNTMATACYREITGEADIAAWFNTHLPQHFRVSAFSSTCLPPQSVPHKCPPNCPLFIVRDTQPLRAGESLESFLSSQGFGALAKYVTTRSKWGLEGGFVLDMDETDFGYSLVEVELLADAKDDLAEASRRYVCMCGDSVGGGMGRSTGEPGAW